MSDLPPSKLDFVLPAYAARADNVGRCRSCGQTILWIITKIGKKAPIDADGTNHFATCPQAGSWRRPK